MPYQVNNTFRPASQFGAPIQALTRAMFSGATPEEREAQLAQAEARRAQSEHYRAQNAKLAAETAGLEQAARRAQDPVANFVNNVFGAERGAEVTNFQRGVNTDQYRGSDGGDGPMTAMAPAARPGWLSPKDEAALNEQARVIAIANNLTGKTAGNGYDDVAKAIRVGAAQDAVMGGADPTRVGQAFGATSGKMPFQQGQFGMGNELTGALADPALFNAAVALSGEKKNTEVAEQGQRRAAGNASNAAAGASGAAAGLSNARRDEVVANREMVPALDAALKQLIGPDGKPVMIRRDQLGPIVMRGEQARETQDNKPVAPGKAGTPGKPRPLTKNDTDLMRVEMTQLLDSLDAGDADEQTKRAIIAQAEKEWQTGAAGHATAVKAAIDKMAPEGFKRGGVYGFRKSAPVGGARASGTITPAAPVNVQTVKSEADMSAAIQQAQEAIKRGADPAKVRERLQQMGVKLTDS